MDSTGCSLYGFFFSTKCLDKNGDGHVHFVCYFCSVKEILLTRSEKYNGKNGWRQRRRQRQNGKRYMPKILGTYYPKTSKHLNLQWQGNATTKVSCQVVMGVWSAWIFTWSYYSMSPTVWMDQIVEEKFRRTQNKHCAPIWKRRDLSSF